MVDKIGKNYENICPEVFNDCVFALDEEVFFDGKMGLGPCIKESNCDEKLLRTIRDLGIEPMYYY